MNAKKTPLQQVNEEHGGKVKLVDKVLGVIERGEEDADELKARLRKASNKQLLRLLSVGSTIKDKYGSAAKLAETVGEKLGRGKDKDYVNRLATRSPAKLLDMARSLAGEARKPLKMAYNAAKPAASKVAAAAKKLAKKAPAKKPAAAKKAAPAKKPAKK